MTLKGTEQLKMLVGSSTYNVIQKISGASFISKEYLDGIVLPLWKNQ